MRADPPEFQSGDLLICPALGQLVDSTGRSVRLGPVNMKVLVALLTRPGEVIGRAELYAAVWKNQVVGEDALNRCISDIRAELRALSGRDDWIETLPKRGYRWIGEARRVEANERDAGDATPPPAPRAATRTLRLRRRALQLSLRGAVYLLALAVMASLIVWSIDRLTGARPPILAVLPVSAPPEHAELAAEVDLALAAYLAGLDIVQVLSRSAIESRPANPFPFFYYEFGARWLVESDIRSVSGHTMLTLRIADARTGIVEIQITERVSPADTFGASALADLYRFLETRLSG